MKIYFDGCSYTRGDELSDPEKTRFSKIIANKLNSIDYNFAISGGSNRRIARNLLEKDLSQYDIFIIQFTKILRTEYYNGVRWIKVKYPEFKNNKFRMG